jgi:NitT/TauT family transport system ATP-binding protein
MRPKILLMDEAFSALDPGTRLGMQRLIRDLWRETGTTILFVTHHSREAVTLATRVIGLGRRRGEEEGADVILDLALPDTLLENDGEAKIADLVRIVEQRTFPDGMAGADEDGTVVG